MKKRKIIIQKAAALSVLFIAGCSSEPDIMGEADPRKTAKELAGIMQGYMFPFVMAAVIGNIAICAAMFIMAPSEDAISWAKERMVKILFAEIAFLLLPALIRAAIDIA